MKICCPCCNNNKRLNNIGKIPTFYVVGNMELDKKNYEDRFLYFCQDCSFYFVQSNYTYDYFVKIYKNLDISHWNDFVDKRFDWLFAKNYIIKNVKKNASILDLGCWDGKFLSYLGDEYNKFGIELNTCAAAIARDRNVNIICDDFHDIDALNIKFDVITAFDVIEHVYNPYLFMTNLKKYLKKNGIIILSTCNSDNFLWKYIFKNRYYYCTILEHISFINLKWMKKVCEANNYELIMSAKFSHHVDKRVKIIFRNLLQNLVFVMNPKLYNFLKNKKSLKKEVPDLFNYKDHMLVILKNKG